MWHPSDPLVCFLVSPGSIVNVEKQVWPPCYENSRVTRYSGTSGVRIWAMSPGNPLRKTNIVVADD